MTTTAQRLHAVSLDLAATDGPCLPDEMTAQLPTLYLVAQRRSRHPEKGSGFGEGEHLARSRGEAVGATERLALGVEAVLPESRVVDRTTDVGPVNLVVALDERLVGGVPVDRLAHLGLLLGCHALNVRAIGHVVKRVLPFRETEPVWWA